MGLVYEGFDPNVGRRVAIKTILVQSLPPELVAEFENRFRTEARSAGRLQHPNIVSVYDADRDIDVAYLVMEFVKGRDLKQLIDESATFTLSDIRSIMRQLLGALDSAHRQNIIHRDVKPANMLIQEDGGLKLTDFGVARIADSGEATRTGGGLVGTLKYMSPEQVKGLPIDSRADLFSAGVVLYQLLTGRQPFRGDNDFALIRQIANEDPPAPSVLNGSLNAEVDAVVAKALAKEPADRYATAREFASDLRRVLQQAEGVAPTPDPSADDGVTPETFSDTRTPASAQFVSRLAVTSSELAASSDSRSQDASVSSVTSFNSLGLDDEATVVVQRGGSAAGHGAPADVQAVPAAGDPQSSPAPTSGQVVSPADAIGRPAGGARWALLGGGLVIVLALGWMFVGGKGGAPATVDQTTTLPLQAATPAASVPSAAASAVVLPGQGFQSKSPAAKTVTASVSKRTVTTPSGEAVGGQGSARAGTETSRTASAIATPGPVVGAAPTTGPVRPVAASPSAACVDRSWLTRSNCVFQQCERAPEFRNHPECVAQREEFRQREERERNR
jgi:serine/threonine-protein kinase